MGVQKFHTVLSVGGEPFYEVDSSFGWFLPAVFEKQTGALHRNPNPNPDP